MNYIISMEGIHLEIQDMDWLECWKIHCVTYSYFSHDGSLALKTFSFPCHARVFGLKKNKNTYPI